MNYRYASGLAVLLLAAFLMIKDHMCREGMTKSHAPTAAEVYGRTAQPSKKNALTNDGSSTDSLISKDGDEIVHSSLKAAFPEITTVVHDWMKFNQEAKRLTVSPYPDIPIAFDVVRVKNEERYVTWFGSNAQIPGSSLIAVATSVGGYHAVMTVPGSSQFFFDVGPDGRTIVSETQPGEEGCTVPPAQPNRTAIQAPVSSSAFKAQYMAAGLSYDANGGMLMSGTPLVDANALNVDVLVLYDSDCLDATSDEWRNGILLNQDGSRQAVPTNLPDFIDGRSKASIEFGNVVLTNSGVTNFQWRYLGSRPVPAYTRSGSDVNIDADLNALAPGGIVGDAVASLEYQLGADQIFLWRGKGAGSTASGAANFAKQQAVSAHQGRAVGLWGSSAKLMIHELAHNFGAAHDRANANSFLGSFTAGVPDNDGFYAYGVEWRTDPQVTSYTIPKGTQVIDYHNGNLTFSEPDGTQVYGYSRDMTYAVSVIGSTAPNGSYTLTNTTYNTASTIMGYGAAVIPYFSNPNITIHVVGALSNSGNSGDWGTLPIGFPISDPRAAFNAKVMMDNATAMSALSEAITFPSITTQPKNVAASAGGSVSLSVSVTGGGLVFQWSKGGTAIKGATNATLTLNNATTSDAGSYTVTATNQLGSVTSVAASVTVSSAVAPVVSPPPASTSNSSGSGGGGVLNSWFVYVLSVFIAIRFFCSFRNEPPPNPVGAGIASMADLKDYRYSSYRYLERTKLRPHWLDFRTVLAEAGALSDTAMGRQKYGKYLAWQSTDGPVGRNKAYVSLSRGWALGTKAFKTGLVKDHALAATTRTWESTGAREIREQQWEECLSKRLKKAGRSLEAARSDRKSAAWKVAIAAELKRTTQTTNGWLADVLRMGSGRP